MEAPEWTIDLSSKFCSIVCVVCVLLLDLLLEVYFFLSKHDNLDYYCL